jgi:aspartate carbamoyltransferase catalytic subunit
LRCLSAEQIQNLFQTAVFFKTKEVKPRLENKIVAHLFFEPSTRTRMSFEMATMRLGATSNLLNAKWGTSLEKDESIEDTILNVAAMKPDALVVRCGDEVDLADLAKRVPMPLLNAGWGQKGHPTQALLDMLTIQEQGRQIAQEHLLFVGDVKHSRVVSSHLELAEKIGYKIAFCGPKEMMPANSRTLYFEDLQAGLDWATSVMALRVQLERHREEIKIEDYHQSYQLNPNRVKNWKSKGLILHPGPVNYGVELTQGLTQDPRAVIMEQVAHGVLIRMSILYHSMKGTI